MMSELESDTAAFHSSQTSAWEWAEGAQTLGERTGEDEQEGLIQNLTSQ